MKKKLRLTHNTPCISPGGCSSPPGLSLSDENYVSIEDTLRIFEAELIPEKRYRLKRTPIELTYEEKRERYLAAYRYNSRNLKYSEKTGKPITLTKYNSEWGEYNANPDLTFDYNLNPYNPEGYFHNCSLRGTCSSICIDIDCHKGTVSYATFRLLQVMTQLDRLGLIYEVGVSSTNSQGSPRGYHVYLYSARAENTYKVSQALRYHFGHLKQTELYPYPEKYGVHKNQNGFRMCFIQKVDGKTGYLFKKLDHIYNDTFDNLFTTNNQTVNIGVNLTVEEWRKENSRDGGLWTAFNETLDPDLSIDEYHEAVKDHAYFLRMENYCFTKGMVAHYFGIKEPAARKRIEVFRKRIGLEPSIPSALPNQAHLYSTGYERSATDAVGAYKPIPGERHGCLRSLITRLIGQGRTLVQCLAAADDLHAEYVKNGGETSREENEKEARRMFKSFSKQEPAVKYLCNEVPIISVDTPIVDLCKNGEKSFTSSRRHNKEFERPTGSRSRHGDNDEYRYGNR